MKKRGVVAKVSFSMASEALRERDSGGASKIMKSRGKDTSSSTATAAVDKALWVE